MNNLAESQAAPVIQAFGAFGTNYGAHRIALRGADFIDPENVSNLRLRKPFTDKTVSRLFGLQTSRFIAFEVPTKLLGLQRGDSYKCFHERGTQLAINLLSDIFPRMLQEFPAAFPAAEYTPCDGASYMTGYYTRRGSCSLHWDTLNSPIQAFVYHKDPGLYGGDFLVGDLAAFLAHYPGKRDLRIYATPFCFWPDYKKFVKNYSVRIPLSSEYVSVIVVNNSVDPFVDGCLHGATAAWGKGWRRFSRTAIVDRNYSWNQNLIYVPPWFEDYMKSEPGDFEGFYLARTGQALMRAEVQKVARAA